jgi:transcriptional regulator
MYVPKAFQEDRLPVLHDAIRQAGLATLVTASPDGLAASHVPMLLDAAQGPNGTLIGHVARANPLWQRVTPDMPALAIFAGPDAYISPSWYATKQETGKVVPTWDYVAVHAHGTIEFFDDADRLLDVVTRLTDRHEGGRAAPWAVADAPDDFVATMLKAIVGFHLPIGRLEGAWKMSQNRNETDRAGVVAGLQDDADANGSAVAALIAGGLAGSPGGPPSKS